MCRLRVGPDWKGPSTEEMASSGGNQWRVCPCWAQEADDMVLKRSLWKQDGEDTGREMEARKGEKNSKLTTL